MVIKSIVFSNLDTSLVAIICSLTKDYKYNELINQSEKYGARVALFGRKINLAEDPLAIVSFMREVASGNIQPLDAVKAYHAGLQKSGLTPIRALGVDSEITEKVLMAG